MTVEHIHPCAFKKCKAPATKKVTHYGQYPHLVCEKHVSWAKRRVIEIDES